MAAPQIARRRRWAPGPNARINWSHPLAVGLVCCLDVSGRDLVTGAILSSNSPGGPVVGPYGNADFITPATAARRTLPYVIAAPAALTLDMVAPRPATGSLRVGQWGNSATDCKYLLDLGSDGSVGAAIYNGSFRIAGAAAGTVGVGQWVTCTLLAGGKIGSSPDVNASVDGRPVAVSSIAGDTDQSLSAQLYGFGTNESATFGGAWSASRLWNRRLSDAELVSLAADPFQFLRF